MFSENTILKSVSKFNGELFLLQGEEDNIVPRESGLKIIKHAKTSKKSVLIVPGANHNFTCLYSTPSKGMEKKFASIIIDFMREK